jgi:hypothetical protein
MAGFSVVLVQDNGFVQAAGVVQQPGGFSKSVWGASFGGALVQADGLVYVVGPTQQLCRLP